MNMHILILEWNYDVRTQKTSTVIDSDLYSNPCSRNLNILKIQHTGTACKTWKITRVIKNKMVKAKYTIMWNVILIKNEWLFISVIITNLILL